METKDFLEQLNVKNVFFNGNIKFISNINTKRNDNLNKNYLMQNKFWLAASTHVGEEIFCIKTHLKIKEKIKDIITIIAPRHIDKVKKIKSLCEKFNLKTEVLNKDQSISKGKEIIIINTFGILQDYFNMAKSVFIGKSLLKKFKNDGGQNPIDAAKLGCKIYHGPYVYNFDDIYKFLKANNVSKEIQNFNELGENIIKDFEDPVQKGDHFNNLINKLGDETFKKTMKDINKFLSNEIY